MVRLPGLNTGRLYLQEDNSGAYFCSRLSRSQGHSTAGRIKSIKKSNEPFGNRTRDLPTCSAVPQLTEQCKDRYYLKAQISKNIAHSKHDSKYVLWSSNNVKIKYLFWCHWLFLGATAPGGPGPPPSRRNTVGRTLLDELSARRRDLYLAALITHNRQTSMSTVGFKPTISAGDWPQTHALDCAATGIGSLTILT